MLILVHAATFEMQNIKMLIIDRDMSPVSRGLISKFQGSPFYKLTESTFSSVAAENAMKNGEVDIILEIPQHFEKDLVRQNKSDVQIIINAINGSAAALTYAYTGSIIADYNKKLNSDLPKYFSNPGISTTITDISFSPNPSAITDLNSPSFRTQNSAFRINVNHWYNPELNYKTFMVPGILALLVTIVGLFLTAMNVVKEKELGTIEQINVSPIKKYQLIIGKLVPFWLIGMFELSFGLTIGKILFDIPMVGNLLVIFTFTAIYLVVVLGMGLFIATVTNTQQQAMFIAWFFVVIFILMSGLFTAVENMPQWAQTLNKINPVAYYMKALRMNLLKGSGFSELKTEFLSLLIYGIAILSLAIWRYRKTT
jgi:ABC-2 type transport system permease protein